MPPVTTPRPDATDIQGNLVGFNKDHVRLLYFTFPGQQAGRAFLGAMSATELTNARDTLQVNALVKQVEAHEHQDSDTISSSGVNLLLSATGLAVLGAPELSAMPPEFLAGMASRAATLGDTGTSAPTGWAAPFSSGGPVHAMVVIAADTGTGLDERTATVTALATSAGISLIGEQDGNARPAPFTGHEHFGFKDGISQPSIDGLTTSSKGGEAIAAGEFIVGLPDQDGNPGGQNPTAPAAPGQPGYPPATPTEPTVPLPAWASGGSFVVYRRLRQDVAGFNQWLANNAAASNLTADQLGAKLVGRWKSGAPMEHVAGEAAGTDGSTADPSIANPALLDDRHINHFDYAALDADGHRVPRAAHIRKTYPRDQANPGHDEADRHRIIRRGIAYGPELVAGEPAYDGGTVPDTQDRGLLFLCYQSSISRGFEFIQSTWANPSAFPCAGDGTDPFAAQDDSGSGFAIPPANPHLALAQWVTTTGGEYLFAPAISAVLALAAGT